MSPEEPKKVEALLILLPVFLIFPVIYVVLIAVSIQAKRREAEEAKAFSPEAGEEQSLHILGE
jgi:flagellar biosynthesis/type III secretory pathway M-ring protein FliF/YscJ